MDASPIPTRIRNVELTLEHGGETLTATPVQRLGDDLDAVLTAEDARSWCFVPLFDLEHPKKEGSRSRARREKKSARALAALDVRTRAGTLSETTAREGEDAPRSAPGVFLFDLREVDPLYRIVSFMVTGLLLLVGSYFYSRLGNKAVARKGAEQE